MLQCIESGADRFAAPSISLEKEGAADFFHQLGRLLREHPWRLALGCMLDFTEAAGYYGVFAFLPLIVLPRVHIAEEQAPWFFLIGNLGAFLGGALAAALLDRAGRKTTVTSFYLGAALSMVGMGVATLSSQAGGVLAAFVAVNFCATGSWVSAYPTFSEIFPTALRSTGIGFSVAFGLIGAGLAPLLLVTIAQQWSVMTSFAVLGGFYLLGALVMAPWILYGPEARGRALEVLCVEKT